MQLGNRESWRKSERTVTIDRRFSRKAE
ncbi:hypothetical protein M3J09_009378 [Ascochyta lentis]